MIFVACSLWFRGTDEEYGLVRFDKEGACRLMHLLGVDRKITIQLRVEERRVAVEQGELRQLEGATEGRLQAGAFNRALAGEAAQAVLILGLRQLARRDAVAFDATDLGFDDGLHRLALDLGFVNDEDSELARPAPLFERAADFERGGGSLDQRLVKPRAVAVEENRFQQRDGVKVRVAAVGRLPGERHG